MDDIDTAIASLEGWEEAKSNLAGCIIHFQYIERLLSISISALSGIDQEVGDIVTNEMSFRARLATFSALLTHRAETGQLPKDIEELIKRIIRAEQERNRLVHSLWVFAEDKPGVINRQKSSIRKNRYSTQDEDVSLEELEETESSFVGIIDDIFYTLTKYYPSIEKKLQDAEI